MHVDMYMYVCSLAYMHPFYRYVHVQPTSIHVLGGQLRASNLARGLGAPTMSPEFLSPKLSELGCDHMPQALDLQPMLRSCEARAGD